MPSKPRTYTPGKYYRSSYETTKQKVKKNTKNISKLKSATEVKSLVTVFDVPLILNDGTDLKALTLISGAIADGARVGNEIEVQEILVRGHVLMDPNVLQFDNVVRLAIVAQKNNQVPAFSGVFNSVDVYSHRNLLYKKLSTILSDRTWQLSNASKTSVYFNFKIKRKLKLRYSGTATTDIAYNQITAFLISDAGIRWPAGYINFEVKYTDA